jgi:hypothetical protein
VARELEELEEGEEVVASFVTVTVLIILCPCHPYWNLLLTGSSLGQFQLCHIKARSLCILCAEKEHVAPPMTQSSIEEQFCLSEIMTLLVWELGP